MRSELTSRRIEMIGQVNRSRGEEVLVIRIQRSVAKDEQNGANFEGRACFFPLASARFGTTNTKRRQ